MLEASQTDTQAGPPKRRQLGIDDASIDFMGRAARSAPMPEDSLTQSPVRDITTAVHALVGRLRQVNMESLFRTQGVLSQLTGADIEAKLRFELDVRQVSADVTALQGQCYQAKRLRHDLRLTRRQIVAEQERLTRIIAAARNAVSAADDPDPDLLVRFERRLGNLIALSASNDVTCAQIALADSNITQLIDRVEDVCTTLFALWQRDALAVAQSAVPVKKASPLATAFLHTHDQLLAKLF